MSKEKLLYVLEILKRTDEEHALTIAEIINKLQLYGIEAERKSISRDIQTLIESGYSILSAGKREGYYLAEREFDDYELTMIFAAVARAKFITERDTRNILKKLKIISSPSMQKLLSEMIAIGTTKTDNMETKYTIDKTIRAIKDNRKLCFQYFEYDSLAKRKLRREGHIYTVSPFYLAWAKEELFLIANPNSHANLTHFKLAMMTNVKISNTPRKNHNDIAEFSRNFVLGKYMRESINMYTGEAIEITFCFHNSIISELINEFGNNFWISRKDSESLFATVHAADNEGLYRLILQYGSKIEILSPPQVREAIKNALSATLAIYK